MEKLSTVLKNCQDCTWDGKEFGGCESKAILEEYGVDASRMNCKNVVFKTISLLMKTPLELKDLIDMIGRDVHISVVPIFKGIEDMDIINQIVNIEVKYDVKMEEVVFTVVSEKSHSYSSQSHCFYNTIYGKI